MAETKYRIEWSTTFKMAAVCLLIELLGLIGLVPVVGSTINGFIVGCAEVIFFFWLRSYGVAFFKSPTSMIATAVAAAVEFLFGFIPAFSLQIGIIIASSWAEDRLLGNKEESEPQIAQPKPRREFKNFPENAEEATEDERPQMSDI